MQIWYECIPDEVTIIVEDPSAIYRKVSIFPSAMSYTDALRVRLRDTQCAARLLQSAIDVSTA